MLIFYITKILAQMDWLIGCQNLKTKFNLLHALLPPEFHHPKLICFGMEERKKRGQDEWAKEAGFQNVYTPKKGWALRLTSNRCVGCFRHFFYTAHEVYVQNVGLWKNVDLVAIQSLDSQSWIFDSQNCWQKVVFSSKIFRRLQKITPNRSNLRYIKL